MKHLLQFLFIGFLCSCISLGSCNLFDDDSPKPKTELEKLPPATQEGKDTFGCLVNGMAWFTTSSTNAVASYQLGGLSISAKIFEPKFQNISISLRDPNDGPALDQGSYDLVYPNVYVPWVTFIYSTSCWYGGSSNLDNTISGTITITKFDKVNYIISGLFEFTTVHNGCDTLIITNGRFDLMYAP